MSDDLTCIHQPGGLCPACREDFEADPSAWLEFGDHPAGRANWRALLDDIAADAARTPPAAASDSEIPF